MKQDLIIVLDLGSDENSLLARQVRKLGVYSEIHPHDITIAEINAMPNLKGIILNGGKNNIIDGQKIDIFDEVYNINIPIVSINHDTSKCNKIAVDDLKSFIFDTAKCQANWSIENFIEDQVAILQKQIGNKKVLLALSGGVDSSVVAGLLIRAIGNKVTLVHVNNGLMRKNESEEVIELFKNKLNANFVYVDAVDRFLKKLENISDPEEKRKIIGHEFINIFEEEARKLNGINFLAQGTIYPDIIESGTKTVKGVKAHHNVGGLPDDLKFELVEPIKYLFKDEVRACGKALGLPDDMIDRQPFPGPGLGVRCLGKINRDRLEAIRESDAILQEEFKKANLNNKVWQYFTLIPDVKTVGVKNNKRSFEYPVIIRAVNTVDAMTATIEHIDWVVLDKITKRIITEVDGVNRVCYDLTPKPTGTIEWE